MKKRLSKLALLAVAAAFMLAGFPACDDGDDGGEPPAQASATFAGVEIPEGGLALTAGEPKDVTATLTVTNTAFSDAVKALDANASLADYLVLSAGEKVSVEAKLTDKVEGNTMKITLSVTADADATADTGSITATLKAAALTVAKDVAATGAISYTVTAADPNAPKATLAGEVGELTKGDAKTVTATVTMTQGSFATTIEKEHFALKATDSKVTVTVTAATKTSDTVATLTFSVTAEEGATNGTITANVQADALADYDKQVLASGSIAFTVKDDGKPDETVYFTSFVASKDLDKAADSTDYETLTSKDGLVTMGRTKYQSVGEPYTTIDYDEETGSGYTYTARVKVNKSNASGTGALTIESVKVGAILRIDGGNASSGVRKMEITGADESVWAAGAQGTFYLTATASTVVLSSVDNEFCIYGIHVVDKKAAESVVKEDTAYVAPVVTLSETSVVKDSEVTITATIPAATKTTTYSTGKVDSETVPVNADITYNGATVADGKVDTTSEGTLTITASYTVDEQTYTSEAVTLEVTGAFAEQTAEVANNEDTLGLTATEVSSANTDIATAKIEDSKIVITSKSKGNTTITAGDGTNTATIDVTVKANGGIETKLHKYAVIETITWAVSNSTDLSGKSTLVGVDVSSVEGYATKETVTWTDTASKFKYEGASTISVATFMTNLKKTGTECITSGNYAQVVITNNTGKDITLSKLEYTHSISDKNSGYGCQAFYWIGGTTGDGTALAASSYGATSAILTKATASFEEDVVVKNQQSVTIRFAYYGGSNGNKLCALKDVVLSVK